MAKSNKTQGRKVNPSRGGQHNHPMGTAGPSYGPAHTHQVNPNNGVHSGTNQHGHTTLPSTDGGMNPGHTHNATGGQHSNEGPSHLHEYGLGGSGQFSHTHNAGSPNIFMSGQHQHAGGEIRGGNNNSGTRTDNTRSSINTQAGGVGEMEQTYQGWQTSGDGFPGTGDFYTGPTWEQQVTTKVHHYNFGYPNYTMDSPSPDSFMYTNNIQLPDNISGFGIIPGIGPNRVLISAPHAQNQYRPTRWNKICAQTGNPDNWPALLFTVGNGCNSSADCPTSHPVCTSNSPEGGGYYCDTGGYQSECAKEVDFCTGPLARTAAELSGAHLIYAKFIQEDPNYYDNIGIDMQSREATWNLQSNNEFNETGIQTEAYWSSWVQNNHSVEHPYKAALRAYLIQHPEIKFVLDIHGASNSNGWDIDLGSMDYTSLPIELLYAHYAPQLDLSTDIREILFNNGIGNTMGGNYEIGPISHNDFSADGQYTVTKFAKEELGRHSLQLEWARIFRCVDNNHTFNEEQNHQTFKAVNATIEIVQHLNNYYNMIDPL